MKKSGVAFIGIDTAKLKNAVAVAEAGRDGEVRYLGEFENTPDAVAQRMRKLASRYERLHVCYEAGPTGYGLYRQIQALGHECMVVAPSLIPRRTGERVKCAHARWRWKIIGVSASMSVRFCCAMDAATTARRAGAVGTSGGLTDRPSPIRRNGWPTRKC